MSSNNQHIVLVTGISGFVASHVSLELLKKGFHVRGTARTAKLEALRASKLTEMYPNLELVLVDDILSDDISAFLKGVDSVIHIASPLAGQGTPQFMIDSAINGTLNIFRQAEAAGIRKFVLTSSIVTVYPRLDEGNVFNGYTYSEEVIAHTTQDEAKADPENALRVYMASKILAEEVAINFAKHNLGVKLATINPPLVYGPTAPNFPPPPSASSLGTNRFIYALLNGQIPPLLPPQFCDVRDVANAHVAALLAVQGDTIKVNLPERFLVGAGAFHWKEAAEYLVNAKNLSYEVKAKLPPKEERDALPPFPGPVSLINTTRAKNILGMTEYIDWQTSVMDTVLCLLEEQKYWSESSGVHN
ncbi:NAD-P-binding protein [Lentinula aciculospora]|uniref:NAD-P-binding protein n=1 Tax=Lentinula aciculospora TaxID=153920 RepID=A0A9W9DEJ5_9AGAR|nr:NAD-P-binding protein [Lentinula aciculospora]